MAFFHIANSNCFAVSFAAIALSLSTASIAAGSASADAVYRRDRAACNSGQSSQDRATCLKEAGAALQEARRGRLDDGQAQFEQNRLSRCDRQPAQDRADCVRRMNGEGTTSGSVDGGGILRELVVPVVPPRDN